MRTILKKGILFVSNSLKPLFSSTQKVLLNLVIISFTFIVLLSFYISFKADRKQQIIEKKIKTFSYKVTNEQERKVEFKNDENADLSSQPRSGLYKSISIDEKYTDYFVDGSIEEIRPVLTNNIKYFILKLKKVNKYQIVIPEDLKSATGRKSPSFLMGKEQELDYVQMRLRYENGESQVENLKEWDFMRFYMK